ncbi:MAG TPA: hypothetical protein VIG46_09155 [Candidatus Baltobacteraceae bacterium]|jgi:hypothetical protein
MDSSSSSSAGATAFVGAFILVYIVIICAAVAFAIWVHWRILAKAGFNGALALLILIPLGGLVPLLMLAFGRWPIEDQLAAALAGRPAPPVSPNPFAGPPATQ